MDVDLKNGEHLLKYQRLLQVLCIDANAETLARYALICKENGL